MAFAFDTLAFARKLREAGIPQDQAEAHAEAARQFIMAELVTKPDLLAVRTDLQNAVAMLENKIDTMTLRLTVRLGAMLAAGIAILGAIQKLT